MSEGGTLRQVFVNVTLDATLSALFEPCSYGLPVVEETPCATTKIGTETDPNTSKKKSPNNKSTAANDDHRAELLEVATTNNDITTDNHPQEEHNSNTAQSDGVGQFQPSFDQRKNNSVVTHEKYELRMCNQKNTVAEIKQRLLNKPKENEVTALNDSEDADEDADEDVDEDELGFVRKAKTTDPNDGLVLLQKYPRAVLVLKYKGDIMDDADTLSDFGVKSNVYGYVTFDLIVCINHGAPEPLVAIVVGHAKATKKHLEQPQRHPSHRFGTKNNIMAIWEPLAREAVHWPIQPGPPLPKAYLLHAIRCGGSKGVLRILTQWYGHARNHEESLWSLILLGARSGSGIAYRNRLVHHDHVLQHIAMSVDKFPEHVGVQKQNIGLLHYLTNGSKSQPGSCSICIAIIKEKLITKIFQALAWSNEMLQPMAKAERLGPRGSCFGDVIEYACNTLRNLISGLDDPLRSTKRWTEEDDDLESKNQRQRMQKEIQHQMRQAKTSGELKKAKTCIVGCSFETTALAAVEGLLHALQQNAEATGRKKKK